MGKVKVVCATTGMPFACCRAAENLRSASSIAFGLGINKANVRFVLHHSVRPMFSGPRRPTLNEVFSRCPYVAHLDIFLKIFLIDGTWLEIARDVLSRVWPGGT